MAGKLIVIDGIDGSGKATQTEILFKSLKEKGIEVYKGSFPNYDSMSSALVKMYLNGEINTEVNPYAASSFYAADRYITYINEWKNTYNNGTLIITDRYTTANIIHQMSRLSESDWGEYLEWLFDYEYIKLKIPKPDLVLYLDMHPNTSQKLLSKRYGGDESKKDILEKDINYMLQCRKAALFAAKELGWVVIKCCDTENPFSLEDISQKIIEALIEEKIC